MDEEEILVNNDVVEGSVDDTPLVDVEETPTPKDATEVEEQAPVEKTYTQSDVDNILNSRTQSLNRKHQKELDKYRRTEEILRQGLGAETIDDINTQLTNFYKDQGVDIQEHSGRSDREERILARADVEEIVSLGDDEINSTINELARKNKRTVREEATLNGLMYEVSMRNATAQLKEIGADESITNSDAFKKFASQFNSNVPIKNIYELYNKSIGNLRKQPPTPGSMKSTSIENTEIKDFYTPEEARRFTREDLDKNPALFKALEQSMYKWGKKNR